MRVVFWCARGDLNPHAREEHWHLKPASLPIPPLAHNMERPIIVAFLRELVKCFFFNKNETRTMLAAPRFSH